MWKRERCLRVCKSPRKHYKFNRRKYRCFLKDPEKLRKERQVCAFNKEWNTVSHSCVLKVKEALVAKITKPNEWCVEGSVYQNISSKSSKKKKRLLKSCRKSTVNFNNPRCKECVRLKKRACSKLGRTYKSDRAFCTPSKSKTCVKR